MRGDEPAGWFRMNWRRLRLTGRQGARLRLGPLPWNYAGPLGAIGERRAPGQADFEGRTDSV